MKIPRQYSLVKFNMENLKKKYHSKYPFTSDGVYVYFGEIQNMPGHCVVCDFKSGQIYTGYHIENFIEISEEGYDS